MKTTRILSFVIAAILAQLAMAVGAGAANYCVGSSPACTASPQPDYSFDRPGISAAVSAAKAHPGEDTVILAEGQITLTDQVQLSDTGSEVVHVVGAGPGKTRFVTSTGTLVPIYAQFTSSSSTAGGFSLAVEGSPTNVLGMYVTNGTLHDVKVSETGGSATSFRAFALGNDGKIERAEADIASPGSTGVLAHALNGTLRDVSLKANGTGYGVSISSAGSYDLTRIRIKGFSYGIHLDGGTLTLTDSLIEMGATLNARGLSAFNSNSGSLPIVATVDRTTIVGSGNNQTGIYFGADSANESFTGEFRDLLVYGSGTNFNSGHCKGGGPVNVVTFASWAANVVPVQSGGCSYNAGALFDLQANPPAFRDFAGGDLRLRHDSPVLDLGQTSGSGLTDLRGLARPVDGDDDGAAAVDFGAFEYQRVAPTVTLSADSQQAAIAQQVTFTADAKDIDGDALTFAWSVDGASVGESTQTLATSFAVAGDHTVALTVTDATGLSTATTSIVNVVAPPAPPVDTPLPGPPTAKLVAKPKGPFKRGGRQGRPFKVISSSKPTGIAIAFGGAANAELVLRVRSGRKTKPVAGLQRLKVKDGTLRIAFGGRFANKKLKAGSYRVTITPLAADGRRGSPVKVSFKLK